MRRAQVSDSDIRHDIRSYLARYRIDMTRIRMRVYGGTVRVSGEMYHLGLGDRPVSLGVLESFERDVIGTAGVRNAFLELDNWKLVEGAGWQAVDGATVAQHADHAAPETMVLATMQAEPR